jgi:hypothetical protein
MLSTKKTVTAAAKLVLGLVVVCLFVFNGLALRLHFELHSDNLFAADFLSNFFSDPSSYPDWRLTGAPAFFPDLVLYTIAQTLTPDPGFQIWFTELGQLFLLFSAIVFLIRQISPRRGYYFWIFWAAIANIYIQFILNTDQWIVFSSTNNHFAALVFPIFIIGVCFKSIRSKNNFSYAIITFALAFFSAISTIVAIISFAVPWILLTLCISFFASKNTDLQKTLRINSISVLAGTAIGYGFQKFIVLNEPLADRAGVNKELIERSIRSFYSSLLHALTNPNLSFVEIISYLSIVLGFLFCCLFAWMKVGVNNPDNSIIRESQSINIQNLLLIMFTVWSLVSCSIGGIVSGGMADPFSFRYLQLPLTLMSLVFVLTIVSVFSNNNLKLASISVTLVILAFFVSVFPTSNNLKYQANLLNLSSPSIYQEQSNANCIDELINSGVSLQTGISSYWHARGSLLLLKILSKFFHT